MSREEREFSNQASSHHLLKVHPEAQPTPTTSPTAATENASTATHSHPMEAQRPAPHVSLNVEDDSPEASKIRLQPSHSRQLTENTISSGFYESMVTIIGAILGFFGAIPCCIIFPSPFKTVQQGYVGLVTRFGKCISVVDPGLHKINLMTDSLQLVNIKLRVGDIPRQYVMTKDNVGLNIDSVLTYHIVDPYAATYLVADLHAALIERTQTTLRQIVGTSDLQNCIEHRDMISAQIEKIIVEPAAAWGAKVESILIKDIQLSKDLLDSLSAVARQKKIGDSKVIAAKAEVAAASLMKKASDILSSQAAMQMRYLDTLQSMSRTEGTKIIFTPFSSHTSGAGGTDAKAYQTIENTIRATEAYRA